MARGAAGLGGWSQLGPHRRDRLTSMHIEPRRQRGGLALIERSRHLAVPQLLGLPVAVAASEQPVDVNSHQNNTSIISVQTAGGQPPDGERDGAYPERDPRPPRLPNDSRTARPDPRCASSASPRPSRSLRDCTITRSDASCSPTGLASCRHGHGVVAALPLKPATCRDRTSGARRPLRIAGVRVQFGLAGLVGARPVMSSVAVTVSSAIKRHELQGFDLLAGNGRVDATSRDLHLITSPRREALARLQVEDERLERQVVGQDGWPRPPRPPPAGGRRGGVLPLVCGAGTAWPFRAGPSSSRSDRRGSPL